SSICAVGSPRVCQSLSPLRLEDPLPLPPASDSRTPSRPINPLPPLRRGLAVHWLLDLA
ncbi:hypothetical protein M9458_037012, partial [Cirrhinus mrigala]